MKRLILDGELTVAILIDSSPRCLECNSLEIDNQFLKVRFRSILKLTEGIRRPSLCQVQKRVSREILSFDQD